MFPWGKRGNGVCSDLIKKGSKKGKKKNTNKHFRRRKRRRYNGHDAQQNDGHSHVVGNGNDGDRPIGR